MSLRGIALIQKSKEERESKIQSKDLTYTLVPGEVKKNYCKIIISIRTNTGNNPFTLSYVQEMIQRYAKKRQDHYSQKSGHIRPERNPVTEEEARTLIKELISQGYLKYVLTKKRDKLHPNIPEDGIKYYSFDKFKVIECEESKYFKQKIQRTTHKAELTGGLDQKRCRALRQIYAQFGDKAAFTYEMVKNIPKFYLKMAENKEVGMKDTTREFYLQAARYSESKNEDFLDTWNSLVRNNYITPHAIRARDGRIKTVSGAYKVNMLFVRSCLSGANL